MSKVKQSFVFFKEETSAKISDNELYVNGNESLLISVEGNGEVEIQGVVDVDSKEWFSLASINKSDLTVCKSIVAPGIYSCTVDGYYKLRAEIKTVQDKVSVCVKLI